MKNGPGSSTGIASTISTSRSSGCPTRALEVDQRLHGEGHIPVEPEQPADRLHEQAGKAAGQTRLRPDDPLSAARYQSSRTIRRSSSGRVSSAARCSSTCSTGDWGDFFPLRPTSEVGNYSGPFVPAGRICTNNRSSDGGANNSYQNQKRYKPQFYATCRSSRRLEGEPRFQVRLRHETRPPQLRQGSAVRHLLSRPGAARSDQSTSTTRRCRADQRRELHSRVVQRRGSSTAD